MSLGSKVMDGFFERNDKKRVFYEGTPSLAPSSADSIDFSTGQDRGDEK